VTATTPSSGAPLAEFTGHPAYGLGELRGGLERFVFLLRGSDGEHLPAMNQDPGPGQPAPHAMWRPHAYR
jgi:hypothetical protein